MKLFMSAIMVAMLFVASCDAKKVEPKNILDKDPANTDAKTSTSVKVTLKGKALNVAMVYVPAKWIKDGVTGYPYNEVMRHGMEDAKKEVTLTYTEFPSKSDQDMGVIIERLSNEGGYDLIVMNGFQATRALIATATKYPKQNYLGVEAGTDQEGTKHNLANVAS